MKKTKYGPHFDYLQIGLENVDVIEIDARYIEDFYIGI